MKFRLIAVVLAFAMAAWLPVAAQQPAGQSTPQPATTQDSGKDSAKHSCCCPHENHNADSAAVANHEDHAASCCQASCKDKDAKLCAAKDGKQCCDAKAAKSCCGKDATACNSKASKDCCTGKDQSCCKHVAA